ncbi:hypothetical protein J8M21_22415 [Pseudoalteromonas luteoviolacea]|uniref:hypothetical protein n=1 Tax=Pseudoalteromonas luteoviolacea TaxID=43657 RepID=UPI001B3A50FB|nr:hypothetical protein [Pseudoalteromonas luteoviolacea]MBQ4879969.1 hypothetical protein [Pseudoalteromonas luteoviolacea]MBQ4908986.1 hypothetical protein [Pseudoalteromonas luteoviolacea]
MENNKLNKNYILLKGSFLKSVSGSGGVAGGGGQVDPAVYKLIPPLKSGKV